MAEKKYRFGVRGRLVLLITFLLAGISGTQYILYYLQQQAVIRQLVELNRQINVTIQDIDRQIREHYRLSTASGQSGVPGPPASSRAMSQELKEFIEYVDGNFARLLTGSSGFIDIQEHIERLRKLAAQTENSPGGSSFFKVTVSVMDEMSRKSRQWRYTVSSQAVMPPGEDILQVSIPIIEEGQVHFVHLQYQISDFLEHFQKYRTTSLVVTLFLLVSGLVISLIISGYFTRPIRQVSEGFNRIEQGDLNCQLNIERSDELGQMVAGFNQMVERLKQNKELEKSIYRQERLSSLGKLAASIAHEIKNPLNAINLSLQHLGDKLAFKSRADHELFDRYSRNIQREVARLSKIVDTFLNFSRVSDLERSPVNLNEVIEEVLTLLARDAHDRGVRFETEYSKGGLVKKVDPEKMKTVFMNLVINAIEAMPSGGRVRVTTSGGGDTPARITVSDTGCGITRENLERIFDLYFSTKEQGSGLGLAIVNNIVRDHGGEISVSSNLGTGSDFTVTIP